MIFPHFRSSKTRFGVASIVIGALIYIVLSSWLPQHNATENQNVRDIEHQIEATTNQLQITTEVYIQTLYGARGFMAASREVTRGEWRTFYENIGVTKRLPGLAVLTYVERVPNSEKNAFITSLNLDRSVPEAVTEPLTIKPDTNLPEHLVIKYTEPLTEPIRRNSLGFDFNTEPTRKQLVEKARDTNQPTLSNPVRTVDNNQLGMLLVLPVYDPALPRTTIDDRRETFTGATILGFRPYEFFKHAFQNVQQSGLEVEVFTNESMSPDALIYSSRQQDAVLGVSTPEGSPVIRGNQATSIRQLQIADQTWTLKFTYTIPEPPRFVIPTLSGRIALLLLINLLVGLGVYHFLKLKNP